jgi:hypothetical protein
MCKPVRNERQAQFRYAAGLALDLKGHGLDRRSRRSLLPLIYYNVKLISAQLRFKINPHPRKNNSDSKREQQ